MTSHAHRFRLRPRLLTNEGTPRVTDPILLTPAEAAAALGIGRSKLYELLQGGMLESVHIGACRRIPADALTALVTKLRDAEHDATDR